MREYEILLSDRYIHGGDIDRLCDSSQFLSCVRPLVVRRIMQHIERKLRLATINEVFNRIESGSLPDGIISIFGEFPSYGSSPASSTRCRR